MLLGRGAVRFVVRGPLLRPGERFVSRLVAPRPSPSPPSSAGRRFTIAAPEREESASNSSDSFVLFTNGRGDGGETVAFHRPTILGTVVRDFYFDIAQEDAGIKSVKLTNKDDQRPVSDTMTLEEVLQQTPRLQLHINDAPPTDFPILVEENYLQKQEALRQAKMAAEEKVEKSLRRRTVAVNVGVLTFLNAELAGIIYLTYELGWDLMEPVTCLIGLGMSVLTYVVYMVTKQDLSFEIHGNLYRNRVSSKLMKKLGTDSFVKEADLSSLQVRKNSN